jgi:hypothetical protein
VSQGVRGNALSKRSSERAVRNAPTYPESKETYPLYVKMRTSRLFSGATRRCSTSYSAPGVLADAAHKTGRAKADFELREISKEEYERLRRLLQL